MSDVGDHHDEEDSTVANPEAAEDDDHHQNDDEKSDDDISNRVSFHDFYFFWILIVEIWVIGISNPNEETR